MLYIEDGVVYLTKADYGVLTMNDIKDAMGVAYTLREGDVMTLTVKATPKDESSVIFKTSTVPGGDRLVIRSEDTANAEPGRYSADVQLITADGLPFTLWPRLEGSARYRSSNFKNFIIMPEVTSK